MEKKVSRLEKIRAGAQALLDEKALPPEGEPSRLHKFLHFWVLVGKSFVRNRCPIHASALSYTTLLALIPMLAVAISVTSSLLKKEGEEQIYHFVDNFVSSVIPPADTNAPAAAPTLAINPAAGSGETTLTKPLSAASTNAPNVATETNRNLTITAAPSGTNAPSAFSSKERATTQKEAARFIHEFIQNTRSGALGITGMVLLIVVAIRMLASVEATFNDIWGVTRGRSWLMRVVFYWATLTLCPLLLAGALGLASGPHLQTTQKFITKMPVIGPMIFPALTLLVLWLTFALLYQLVPNTKVRFSAALVGGIVGGTAWHVNNVFGFLYVSRVVSNSKIYGSLGLVPVFMAGLYLSWLILLFGAQVAYAFQNRALYLQERLTENVNQRGREFIALRLMTCLGQRFQRGLPPATIQQISNELGVPSRLIQQVLQTLVAARLVIEISGAEPAYTPARPLETINAHHVLMAMRATQGQELLTRDEPGREEVYSEYNRIQEAEKQVAASVTMLALVNRAQARLELAPPQSPEEEMKVSPALAQAKPEREKSSTKD